MKQPLKVVLGHSFCNQLQADNFGTNQKPVCDFLLVRHCN